MTYVSEVTADTPIAWWRMGDTSGTTAADASGNSHPGTYSGTFLLNQASMISGDADKAVKFTAGGMSVPLNLSSYNKLTIEFWVNWPVMSTSVDQQLIEFTADGMGAGGFGLSNRGGTEFGLRRWKVEMGTTMSAAFGGNPSNPSPANPPLYAHAATPTKKYHVVIELDRTSALLTGRIASAITVWVDAVCRTRTTIAGSTAVGGNFANGTLYIGGRSVSSMFATATIDEVAIYGGTLLSQARIDAHYLAGSGLEWIHPGTKSLDMRTIFPSSNIWRDVLPSDAPLHSSSALWRENLVGQLGLNQAQSTPIRSQVGDPGYRALAYHSGSTNMFIVPASQPLVPVALGEVLEATAWDRIYDLHETFMAGVPVPDHAITENSFDHNITIWQPATRKYWELWAASHPTGNEGSTNPGCTGRDYEWKCYGGGHMRDTALSSGLFQDRFESTAPNRHYEYYFDGQSATSLPMAGGVFSEAEFNAGVIDHALHLILGNAWSTFVYPAHRGDGDYGPDFIPEGSFLRVDPTLDLDALYPGTDYNSRKVKMLAKAAQRYGILTTDKTAVGCAFRMRGVWAYDAENNVGEDVWNPEVGADGYMREWDLMGNFPWGAIQVLDPVWVEARWPASFVEPPAPTPSDPVAELTDDFSGTLDLWTQTNGPFDLTDDQVHLPVTPGYSLLTSATTWKLTGSSISWENVQVPTNDTHDNAGLKLIAYSASDCYVGFWKEGNDLLADYRDSGLVRHGVSLPFNDTQHAWCRIFEVGGVVHWQTSPDGDTWTDFRTVTWVDTGWSSTTLDDMSVQFFGGNWNGVSSPDDFIMDNVNVGVSAPGSGSSPLTSSIVGAAISVVYPGGAEEDSFVGITLG